MSRQGSKQPKQPKQRKPMPAGREARARRPAPAVAFADPSTGAGIVKASWIGTAALAVTSVAAAIDPHALAAPALVVALAEFFGGMLLFGWAYVVALGRSRDHEITVAGAFGLAGSTPRPVQLRLFSSLTAEVAIGVAVFAARPNSSLSFAILASVWGVAAICLWGAKHGAFPPRVDPSRPRRNAR